jgi:hypothetical protein
VDEEAAEEAPLALEEGAQAGWAQPDPFQLVTERGDVLRFRLATQVLQTFAPEAQGGSLLSVRRLRLGLDGLLLDRRLRTAVQFNAQPGNLELVDAFSEWSEGGLLVRAGQFKTPFTRQREQSYLALLGTEWTLAAKAFGAERQLGLSVSSGPAGEHRVDAALGVFSGSNRRASFEQLPAWRAGQSGENPSALAGPPSPVSWHPELVGRVTLSSPGIDAHTTSDPRGGPARGLVGLSGSLDAEPQPGRDFAARLAFEALLKVEHVSLNGVSYLGFLPDQTAAYGLSGELAWRCRPLWGPAVQVDHVDDLGPDGAFDRASEARAGLTFWVAGDAVRVQADGGPRFSPAGATANGRLLATVGF